VGVVLAAILVGGWLVADGLTSAKASTSADSLILETTVKKLVTVREKGKLVTKVIPVVKRVVRVQAHTETRFEHQTDLRYSTRVVTEPGRVRLVRRVVTTRVPVVKNHVITVNGKTKTVAVTSYVPTTRVETQTQTQTQTETRQQTVTQPGASNTVTQTTTLNHTTTDVQTQIVTTTQTVTQTQTQTETQVVTQTQTVTTTQTVTEPAVTVTITLPAP
jgi:serine-aspartate repeat-containing protein C/D/E